MLKLKELEKLFTEGKITRREFMARVSALGLAAAVSPALLASTAEAAKPKKGGRVIAVGTTVVRTLETVAGRDGVLKPGKGIKNVVLTY